MKCSVNFSERRRVVAEGTPEEVARVKKSYTGQALRPALNGHRERKSA